MPTNPAYDQAANTIRSAGKARSSATTRSRSHASKPSPKARTSQPQNRTIGRVGQPRPTEEQKRERNRARATERRQQRINLGLCVTCSNKPIEGQIRCTECAERNQRYWNNWNQKRKKPHPDG